MQSQTHQFSFLHTLHDHEEDLLGLAAVVVKGLLDGHQKLVFHIITHQPVGRTVMDNKCHLKDQTQCLQFDPVKLQYDENRKHDT